MAMKTRIVIIIAMAACLLLGSLALRLDFGRLSLTAQDKALAQSYQPPPPVQYRVAQGAASGGGYRLTGFGWQVSGSSSGGGYRLLGPASPSSGTPCCCNYLPCVRKN
jgi:hypothetical protein